MKYADWEDAAKKGRSMKALSDPFDYIVPGENRVLKVAIVKPLHGDPYLVYNSAIGIRVRNVKVTARQVDAVRRWTGF